MCTQCGDLQYVTHTGRHIQGGMGGIPTYIYTQGGIYREVYTLGIP